MTLKIRLKQALALMLLLAMCCPTTQAEGKRVLFIGDSITDGAWGNNKKWNATSDERNQSDMNHIYGHGFMELCAGFYQATYPQQQHRFWNRGISGNTLADLHGRWSKDVIELKPDVVSILVGTNDVDKALRDSTTLDVQAWSAEFRHLLDTTRTLLPQVHFVVCTPFVAQVGRLQKTSDYAQRETLIQQLDSTLRQIAIDYDAVLVPFDELFSQLRASTPDNPDTYWIWDGIHPTPAGHYRMAELWKSTAGGLIEK